MGEVKFDYRVLLTYLVIFIMVLTSYLVVPFLKDITMYWWVLFPPIFLIIVFGILFSINLITKKLQVALEQ